MGILCIGEALIDMICTDKGTALSEGNHFLKKAGGAPTNVAAAIGALGGSVSIAAKVGSDPFGKHLQKKMHQFGVDTQWMQLDTTSFTTFAFVSLMHNGERDFVFNRGADGELSKSDIEKIPLEKFSIFHFGSATAFLPAPLQTAYTYLLEQALAHNKFISFDPNFRHLLFPGDRSEFIRQSKHFLQHCHFCKLSDEEAILISEKSTIREAIQSLTELTNAVIAITMGKEGTLLCFKGQTYSIPSIPITPVDTTGAGDAFVGAVLFQLSKYSAEEMKQLSLEQWQQITINANKAGARTCEFMGAMEAFEHLTHQIFQ